MIALEWKNDWTVYSLPAREYTGITDGTQTAAVGSGIHCVKFLHSVRTVRVKSTYHMCKSLERGKGGHLTLNEMFLQNSTLPANLAEGSVTSFGQMVPELLGQSLQKVFDTVVHFNG